MKQKDAVDIIKIIDRTYKTDYAGDVDVVKDWYKVLKNYELKDIAESLDYYMKNYTNYPPKVYDLIKGYKTIEAKKLLENAKTRCIYCGKVINFENEEHINKCRSIEFIATTVKRFKKQQIDREKYMKMDDEEFKKYYLSAINLILHNSNNNQEKDIWKKYLKSIGNMV